ncbi:MAG: hypothetical protein R3C68_19710 [Myxococcota bacterium]
MRYFLGLALLLASTEGYAGSIVGKLNIGGRQEADRTVVYVEKVDPRFFKVPKGSVRLSQRGQKFRPTVLPVVAGSDIDMTNDDFVVHNIYSNSQTKHFNLEEQSAWNTDTGKGSAKSSSLPSPVVKFAQQGEVDIHCNIHANMKGAILVLQNPFFTKPDAEGNFKIDDVPEGDYTLKVYGFDPNGSRSSSKSTKITVKKAEPTSASFE